MKKIIAIILGALCALSVVGCTNGRGGASNEIWIAFAETGYGREYLEDWIEEFQKAYPEDNWKFELEGDPQMTGQIGTRLSTDNEVPDIFFGLTTNWQQWASRGLLADLGDVYGAPVDDEGTTLLDFMRPGARDFGKVNGKYYAIPWNDSAAGLIYNKKIFDQYKLQVPQTVEDLYALCDTINRLPVNTDSDKTNDIAPFAWGGQVISYWDFVVQTWWAQYEGAERYSEYFKYDSVDGFKQEGRLKALEVFENLVVGKDGVPKNSYSGAMGDSHILSQMAFLQGKGAMIPMGAWMETEMRKSIPDGFEMLMMPTPFIAGAKTDASGKPIQVNASQAGDFFIVPKNAPNLEGAIKFMKFIHTKEMTLLYTENTGTARPFDYNPLEAEGLSDFQKSCLNIYENSVTVYEFSQSVLSWQNLVSKWPGTGSPYSRMILDNEKASDLYAEMNSYVSEKWPEWQKLIHM
ncbi:extracellular solute-binding protein [Candidatus Borkfalkia ceftriaxoniphila]|uniref:Extracellular solute-binding protein n=1 Tax=Candidatus Borkfalkia ceftriaxoniphila TaxID=2508949 RepID=A0A4V1QVB3_9FIRM|nr:ABC transporter substrate-binding protein [Candidatus Borkfalkia ceftriaxoniphila]RXZ62056.1 extracellular solute-binding protein [Candidatus Borkfalkia ceftriaxoniphila]